MAKKHTVLIALFVNSVFLIALFSLAVQKNKAKPDLGIAQLEDQREQFPTLPSVTDAPKPILDTLPPLPLAVQPEEKKVVEPIANVVEPKVELVEAKTPKQYIELFVKRGDNLSKLAQKYNVSVRDIVKASRLTNTQLRIGQKLKIPKVEQTSNTSAPASEEFYTIQQGDNLWLIASKYKVKVSDLMKLNDLDDHKAKRLQTGDKIRIR